MTKMERLKYYLESCGDKCHGYISDIDELLEELESIKADKDKLWKQVERLAEREVEIKRLRRSLDNIKVWGYEQNRRDFHDMALDALKREHEEVTDDE